MKMPRRDKQTVRIRNGKNIDDHGQCNQTENL